MKNFNDNVSGIKIELKGKLSKEDLILNLINVLTKFDTFLDIDEFSNPKIYFNIYKDGKKQVLVKKDNHLQVTNNLGSTFPDSKTIIKNADGNKTIIFNKEIDLEKVKSTIEDSKNKNNFSHLECIDFTEYTELLHKEEQEREKIRQLERMEYQKKLMEIKQLEEQENENLRKFKEFIANENNVTLKDLTKITTSIALIKDKQTICNYLKIKLNELTYNKVYRVSFRDEKTKKVSSHEIYDLDFGLIKKIIV